MTRSLFSRLALGFLAVVIISTAALGLLLSQLLERHVFAERVRTLTYHGQELADLVGQAMTGTVGSLEVGAYTRLVATVTGAQVWIVDRRGTVVESTRARGSTVRLRGEEFDQLLAGDTIVAVGEFAGRFDIPVLTVGVPIIIAGTSEGAIMLHAPVGGIRQAISALLRLVWIAGAIGIALAVAVAYLISRRIVHPLKTMASMSGQLAAGDFTLRVPAGGHGEIGQLAEAFNDMASRLEQLERTRREFIATLSHELKSPLTSIRGFVHGILDGTIPEDDRDRYLKLAFSEISRLGRLIDEMLLLASLEEGASDLVMASVAIDELAREVSAQMTPRAEDCGVILLTGGEGQPAVSGDRDRLKQALLNLVDNAIRFSPDGQTVTIGWSVKGSAAILEVTDHGPGIEPQVLPRIWDRFFKADRARTRTRGGSGLGLSIARALIRAHGGDITVNSQPGVSTTFTVTLPLPTREPVSDGDPRPVH